LKTINMKLDEHSIEQAIKELQQYKKWTDEKTKQLCERLAVIGAKEASVRFTTAIYDGNNDVSVSVEPTDKGYVIVASGQAVAFLEFGTGVYYNPGEPYPDPRPPGIVGIGEYGKGYGKRNAWGFYNEDGSKVITHGSPAAMPMWYATEEMRQKISEIAKEVFAE